MKIFRFLLLVLLFNLLFGSLVFADHRQFLFDQGNQAYQKGDYDQAIQSYQEILKMGYENADLYYNLGNAYFKAGQTPQAILNYERALRLKPNDEDIRFNLQIANLSVVDKIPQVPELFYLTYFKQFRSLFSLRSLTIITLALYVLFFGAVILWLVARQYKTRLIFKFATFSVLVFLLVFSFTFVSKAHYLRQNVEAVVMSRQVDVRSAPSADGTEIFMIHEGLKIKITETSGDWYEIRLPDGKEGWLPVKDVAVI